MKLDDFLIQLVKYCIENNFVAIAPSVSRKFRGNRNYCHISNIIETFWHQIKKGFLYYSSHFISQAHSTSKTHSVYFCLSGYKSLTLLSKKRYFCLDLSSKPLPIDISFFLHLLILTNKFTLKGLLLLFYAKKYL